MEKLKNCPFCGGRPKIMAYREEIIYIDPDNVYEDEGFFEVWLSENETLNQDCCIECAECGAFTAIASNSDELANIWNSRYIGCVEASQ